MKKSILFTVIFCIYLLGCNSNDTASKIKNDYALSNTEDSVLLSTPVPKAISVNEFFEISAGYGEINDSAIDNMLAIEKAFKQCTTTGKVTDKDLFIIISEMISLKSGLAQFVHASKFNTSFKGVTHCSYLGLSGATKLQREIKPLIEDGITVFKKPDADTFCKFYYHWCTFLHSWNTINQFDKDNCFDEKTWGLQKPH